SDQDPRPRDRLGGGLHESRRRDRSVAQHHRVNPAARPRGGNRDCSGGNRAPSFHPLRNGNARAGLTAPRATHSGFCGTVKLTSLTKARTQQKPCALETSAWTKRGAL